MVQLSTKLNNTILLLLSGFIFFGSSINGWSQTQQDSIPTQDSTVVAQEPTDVGLPSINAGLGIGSFAFIGDVGRDLRGNSPFVTNLGYQLYLSAPAGKNLDFQFNSLFGKVTVHERSLMRNLNFQSQIRGGGVALNYNFKELLGENRVIYPFINAGISSFEFLSKTDLYNADGVQYHFWSDGSIRNLAQDAPGAQDAVIITQDYEYETDLRELNLDNFGDYKERTFSFPIGIGFQMPIHDKVNFRIGTTMYFNQTDLIDNVTDESIGTRKGDSKNDRFLFTNFSLSYSISLRKEYEEEQINEDLLANLNEQDRQDEDSDGVFDILDDCPHTPSGVTVDEKGCPLDDDHDFVANYKDQELRTPENMEVDTNGIGLDDEYFYRKYMQYKNQGGDPVVLKDIVESGNVPLSFMELKTLRDQRISEMKMRNASGDLSSSNRKGNFRLLFHSDKAGVDHDMSFLMLSVPDIEVKEMGDSSYYLSKQYPTLEDAALRQISMALNELPSEVIEIKNGQIINLEQEVQAMQNELIVAGENIDKGTNQLTWRVQLGAFDSNTEITLYDYVSDLVKIKGNDGLTRYLSGSFDNPNEAARHKVELMMQGYTNSTLTAFKDGKYVELDQAGLEVLRKIDYDKIWNEVNDEAFDKNYLEYNILLSKAEERLSAELLNKFITLGEVESIRDYRTVYYIRGHFKSMQNAEKELQAIKDHGIDSAQIVGSYKNKIVPAEEVEAILKQ